MRTKLALLLALSRKPDVLILDEPTEGLDPVSIEELCRRWSWPPCRTTVFFSSHQLSEVERIAERLLMIDPRRSGPRHVARGRSARTTSRVSFGFGHPYPRSRTPTAWSESGSRAVRSASSPAATRTPIRAMARERGASMVDIAPTACGRIFLETVQDQNKRDQEAHWEQAHALV